MIKKNALNLTILFIFLLWRSLLFVIVSFFGEKILFYPSFPYSDIYLTSSGLPSWIWSFANFDGVHYLSIIKSGYSAQFTQVFFPFFPLLIKLTSLILPFVKPILLGLIINNLLFLISVIIFGKLLKLDFSKSQVIWIIIFYIFFPTSFYFGSLYTESLFMLLIFGSFYLARKKMWFYSGIVGGLASATRFIGVFLLPALLWEWYTYKIKNQKSKIKITSQKSKLYDLCHKTLNFTYYSLRSPILYLVPLGLISYMIYLQIKFSDFLYFWHVQPIFGAERSGSSIILFPQVIWRYIKIFFTVSSSNKIYWISVLEFVMTILAIGSLIIGHYKKIRLSYLIFSWFAVIIPTFTGTFSSMPRYILVAFPIYLALGTMENKILKIFLLIILGMLLLFLTVLFTSGFWVA